MRLIEGGAGVMASPYCSTPTTLLGGLAERSRSAPGIVLSAGMLLSDLPFLGDVEAGHLRFRTWHVSPQHRSLASSGRLEYVPLRARDVVSHLRSRVGVALTRVTPPDARGMCSLGPSASYTKAMLTAARIRIAEVDENLPRTYGDDVTVPASLFDRMIEARTPTSTYRSERSNPVSEAIAHNIIPMLRDGVTLQLGIGSVPEAIGHAISTSDVGDLRLVGMLTDQMVDLADQGRLSSFPGTIQPVELLGSARVFDFADRNRRVEMVSSSSAHDVGWLGSHPQLVSICSALTVDLTGQAASEQIGNRLIAGVGGSADFFEGAHLSPGGVRIVALPARTATGGSRISVTLQPGTPVTLPRHSVDYVVTEFGAAHLQGRSLEERAEALISVAAPEHRDDLTERWLHENRK
jgi:4-hydroxybutyrate CoA-transferase